VTQPPESQGTTSTPSPGGRSLAWGPGQTPRRHASGGADGHDDPGYRQIMVRSLIRAQLGLSLVCLVFALAVTALFPALCAVLPQLDHAEIFGLPVTLIALGAGIYPVILIIAFFYNHQANRLERKFISLVGGLPHPARALGEEVREVPRRSARVDRPHPDD
jgi:putative solute:sodium symporter small subunit